MPDEVAYFCSHDGYSPKNRGNWCDLGCGTDYNRMIAVPKRHIDKLLAPAARYEAALRRLTQPTSSPLVEEAALVQIEVMQIAQEALDG